MPRQRKTSVGWESVGSLRQTCERRIRELAGPEFDGGRAEGRGLTLDDAVSLALAAPDAEHQLNKS